MSPEYLKLASKAELEEKLNTVDIIYNDFTSLWHTINPENYTEAETNLWEENKGSIESLRSEIKQTLQVRISELENLAKLPSMDPIIKELGEIYCKI